jgi:hypothetical protein
MGKILQITESQLKKIISEQVSLETETQGTIYVAALGYLSLYGVNLINDPENRERNIAIRNEVIQYCKNKRDGMLPKPLSVPGQELLNKIITDVKNRDNMPELMMAGSTA